MAINSNVPLRIYLIYCLPQLLEGYKYCPSKYKIFIHCRVTDKVASFAFVAMTLHQNYFDYIVHCNNYK